MSEKMTLDQQCEVLACKTNLESRQILKVLKAQAEVAHEELKRGNAYSVYHLGTFERVENGRAEGKFRAKFSISTYLKDALNEV